ncbi:unnamed protein product [Lampetra planeri]
MSRLQRTLASSDDEDEEEVIPPTAPGGGSLEESPTEMLPTEQSVAEDMSALQLPGVGHQPQSTSLANLLSAAAALVAELVMDKPERRWHHWESGKPTRRRQPNSMRGKQVRETAAIMSAERETAPAKSDSPPPPRSESNLQRQVWVVAGTRQLGESGAKQEEKELLEICAALAGSQQPRTSTGWRQEQ